MKIIKRKTESTLMGSPVLMLANWKSGQEILDRESGIVEKYQPGYIYCAVDATDLLTIQQLEGSGFRFSEFRIQSTLNTSQTEVSTHAFFPFQAGLVNEKEDLEKARDILLSSKKHDRFSKDPNLGENFSRKRLEANLRKSFKSYPKEFLLGLYNSQRGELVAFRSGAFLSTLEAHYYQYGVIQESDFEHTASMLEAFTIEFLKNQGIQIIHAVSTGFNTPELNRLLKNYDFRIANTQVLLKKAYNF